MVGVWLFSKFDEIKPCLSFHSSTLLFLANKKRYSRILQNPLGWKKVLS